MRRPPQGDFQTVLQQMSRAQLVCQASHELSDDDDARKRVGDALADMGFRRFSFLGKGTYSLVLQTTDNQVVRIFDTRHSPPDRPYHPAVLQAICTRCVKAGRTDYMIEVLPRVRTTGVTKEDTEMLRTCLEKSGLYVADLDWGGNIGLIDVGGRAVPLLIDAGYARTYDNIRKEAELHPGGTLVEKVREMEKILVKDGSMEHLSAWLDSQGKWLQHEVETRKEASGVITGSQLDAVKRGLGAEDPLRTRRSQIVDAIERDGMYMSEFEGMAARAVQQNGPNFSDAIAAQRIGVKHVRKRQ